MHINALNAKVAIMVNWFALQNQMTGFYLYMIATEV